MVVSREKHMRDIWDSAPTLTSLDGLTVKIPGYVVPLEGMRSFENKDVWVGPEGDVETYFKHHPVPGEGSVRGEEPLVVQK